MKLYFFPLSPYSQKALIALEEKGARYEKMLVNLGDAAARAEYEKVNPFGKVPFLRDDRREWSVPESSSIIEYVDRHVSGGTALVPSDPDHARQARFHDRVFDLYVTEPALKIFFDGQRPTEKRDPYGVEQAQKRIDKTYALLDKHLAGKTWVLGDAFSMGDVSGAPALRIGAHTRPWTEHKNIVAYFQRLSQRPAVASAFKQADDALAERARR